MAVLINFKICDNAPECGGIEACQQGALFWDEKNKTVAIDNDKCISCESCAKACEIGAIKVAKNEEEYKKIEKEIKADPRKITDLFIDRYGASPIQTTFLLEENDFDPKKLEKLTVVEVFNDDSIECLLKSIPINELLKGIEANYFRVKLDSDRPKDKFQIKELPSLLFFKKGAVVGKIEGYYTSNQKEELRQKIEEIIKQNLN